MSSSRNGAISGGITGLAISLLHILPRPTPPFAIVRWVLAISVMGSLVGMAAGLLSMRSPSRRIHSRGVRAAVVLTVFAYSAVVWAPIADAIANPTYNR